MRTFVIFDRKTGEVLQTHVTTDDVADEADDIIRMARPEAMDRAAGLLEVDTLEAGERYRVDVKANRLILQDKTSGAGAAGVQIVAGDVREARQRIVTTES